MILKTQFEDENIWDVAKKGGVVGMLLLLRPVIYLLFSRRRDLNAYSAIDTSAIVFILYSVVCCYFGWKVIANSSSGIGKDVIFKSPIAIFMLYTVLGVVSMAWSVNPALSGFRSFECLAMVLLMIAIVQTLLEKGGIRTLTVWIMLFVSWDIICSLARTLQWTTDLSSLLESSQMMATTFFFMALYVVPRRWYNYLIMVMSIFSMSTVAYIGLALGFISTLWGDYKSKMVAVATGVVLLCTLILVGPYSLLKNTLFFDKNDISIEQTSGRDKLMEVTLESLDEHPMGYGFFAAEPYLLYAKNLGAISAHNSLFSAAMGMGYVGVLLIALFFIATGWYAFSKWHDWELRPILIGCFCVAFLHCMGNPSVGTRVFGAWTPCMLAFVMICSSYVYGKHYEEINLNETNE